MGFGLPAEAQVGIAVGASACALALGALALLAWRRFKQRRAKTSNHYVGMPPAQYPGFQFQRGYTQSGDCSAYSRSSLKTKTSVTKSNSSRSHAEIAPPSIPQELPAAEPAAAELPAH
ncbi:hypothetical protein F4776DRAFT_309499 [Hypoxylon sp. NC0597]|nr:hypothetical protein F4776DRAFT_309499 [Hypoxylon sp. NC0597]